jgi:hypothetical protein
MYVQGLEFRVYTWASDSSKTKPEARASSQPHKLRGVDGRRSGHGHDTRGPEGSSVFSADQQHTESKEHMSRLE